MSGGRERRIISMSGMNGSGKSSAARKLISRYEIAHPESEVIILDPGSQWENGEYPHDAYRNPKALDAWIEDVTGHGEGPPHGRVQMEGALLVLDDCDRYIPSTPYNPWRQVWLASRHLRVDVITTFHRPQGVPKELIAESHELWLFAQDEPRALEYLAKIPALAPLLRGKSVDLPTRPGEVVRILKRERRIERLKLF